MSSTDPTAGAPEPADPRGHEGAPPVPLDAPVESAPADEALRTSPEGADRDAVPAPGAPAELTSDDDRPGQSPDGAAEGPAPVEGRAATVTTTSSVAADDVPVVAEAVEGERVAPEGGDTAREGEDVPARTAERPDATTPGQAEAQPAPPPADVADVRPTDAVTADGTPVPRESSVAATTRTDVADDVAARGDVAAPAAAAAAAPVAPAGDVPAVDVHAEPSGTDAPGGDVAGSGSVPTNPPVDAPTDLPATGATPPDAPAAGGAAPGEAAPADAGSTEAVPADAGSTEVGSVPADRDAQPEPEPVDEERQPLLDLLAQHLGDDLVGSHVVPGKDLTIRVTRDAWVRTAEVCRDVLGMRYFGFLSAIDWMPSPYGRSEDGGLAGAGVDAAFVPPDPDAFSPGTTGGETRFQLLARLQAPVAPSLGITIKCDVPTDDLVMPSWTTVFPGADWHERECAEMFGISFAGHQNLVKLYLPGAFEGFPLRKDFPLLARDVKPWPGLVDVEAMPGEEASEDDASVTAGAEES